MEIKGMEVVLLCLGAMVVLAVSMYVMSRKNQD